MSTFHENLVQSFHNFRDKYLKANSNFFKFSYDETTQKYGFTINGTFHPFAPSDTKDDTISFTSNDNSSIFNSGNLGGQSTYAWTAVSKIATGEKHSSLLNKVSTMFKNIRTIAKLIGTTDISSIGNGTLSGGISQLNTNKQNKTDNTLTTNSKTVTGAINELNNDLSVLATPTVLQSNQIAAGTDTNITIGDISEHSQIELSIAYGGKFLDVQSARVADFLNTGIQCHYYDGANKVIVCIYYVNDTTVRIVSESANTLTAGYEIVGIS